MLFRSVRLRDPGSGSKSVAVLPFMDQRNVSGVEVRHAGDSGSLYLGFIPLMPAGFVTKSAPENSDGFVSLGRYHFDVANDLADAAVLSLKASNLFERVTLANTLEQAEADYIWRGRVNSTYYSGAMLSYCVTYFASPVLWVVGAPSGVSTNELLVDFELIERSTGEVVWSGSYGGRDSVAHWLYAHIGQDVSLYPVLMKQAMNSALFDLARGRVL